MTLPMPWMPKMTGTKTRRMVDAQSHQRLYFTSNEGGDLDEEAVAFCGVKPFHGASRYT